MFRLTVKNQEYDALIDSVCDWAQKFMAPFVLDKEPAAMHHLEESLRSQTQDAIRMQQCLQLTTEHSWASEWPETEEDVVSSMIILFLHRAIFDTVLYGCYSGYIEAIEAMAHSMQLDVQPARGKS